MKVLVVGGGGREHALGWKIAQSPLVAKLYFAPGNPGTEELGENVPIKADELEKLLAFAIEEKITLTVVGPEVPLCLGIVDLFEANGLTIFGPKKDAARIEGSKADSKEFMARHNIPTARFGVFTDIESAYAFVDELKGRCAVKADGLCAGKGVILCTKKEEAYVAINDMLHGNAFGPAGEKVVIEELLVGVEASIMVITDGRKLIPVVAAQDHKALYQGNKGPNTGGMGAYAPTPVVTPEIMEKAMDQIMRPAVLGLSNENRAYRGVLYGGIMIKDGEVKALEFNARFGDPECQPQMVMMESDLLPVLLAAAQGNLGDLEIKWKEGSAVCVVFAAANYPGTPRTGDEIEGLYNLKGIRNVYIFHAGTTRKDRQFFTAGGRVLGITAYDPLGIKAAINLAYIAANQIKFKGMQIRHDIGATAIIE